MTGKIFINYRRGDDPGNTGRLFDRLQETFAPEQLFMDVDSIAPGLDFVQVLGKHVRQCDALLAVIGPRWLDATDRHGGRRLEDPNDFVRIEIAAALSQGKRVIPGWLVKRKCRARMSFRKKSGHLLDATPYG